jgi:hypothetical protein
MSTEAGDSAKIQYNQGKVNGVATYKNSKGETFTGRFKQNILHGPLFKKANKTAAYKHVNVSEDFLYENLKGL